MLSPGTGVQQPMISILRRNGWPPDQADPQVGGVADQRCAHHRSRGLLGRILLDLDLDARAVDAAQLVDDFVALQLAQRHLVIQIVDTAHRHPAQQLRQLVVGGQVERIEPFFDDVLA